MKRSDIEIIAGPCSAETKEQVLQTAKELKEQGVNEFRAGIWKPRTRPGGFEGYGVEALEWMEEVKNKLKMKVGCEVANDLQCRSAIYFLMDFIWIGARTTTDPFAVQEIADAIKKYSEFYKHTPIVYIKNPVCPDYDLWVGACERIKKTTGLPDDNIKVIFRGFKTYNETKYRNEPIWDIPLKMMVDHPEWKMYCDPSHISGDHNLVKEICDIAINEYNMQGLMIEAHCAPEEALTDVKQQILPSEISEITSHFIEKTDNRIPVDDFREGQNFHHFMKYYRNLIDSIDNKIVNLLHDRLVKCMLIGQQKKKNNVATYQGDRWTEVLNNVTSTSDNVTYPGWNDEQKKIIDYLLKEVYESIHSASIKLQNT